MIIPMMAQSPPLEARSYTDALGVMVHYNQSWRSYLPRARDVEAKLVRLGVRHIRDGITSNPAITAEFDRLAVRHKIRSLLIVDVRQPSPENWRGRLDLNAIPDQLKIIKDHYRNSCEAIEGPNEYDVNHDSPVPEVNDREWTKTYRAFAKRLYESAKADPVLRTIKILNGPMAHARNAAEVPGLDAYLDAASFHPYPGGGPPSQGLSDYNIAKTREMVSGRPLWATETGYHNAVKKPTKPQEHNPVPESVSGIYAPRLIAEYLRQGITRTYFYELLDGGEDTGDQEQNFGLLRSDFSEKPAYTSLRSAMTILNDRGSGSPKALGYTISGNMADVRQLLLAGRDGKTRLLLWIEKSIWDEVGGMPISVPAQAVTVK